MRVRRPAFAAALLTASLTAAVLVPSTAASAAGKRKIGPFKSAATSSLSLSADLRRVKAPVTSPTTATTSPAPVTSTIWADGGVYGDWYSDFNGYGTNLQESTGDIVLSPQASTQPDETHASLVTTRATYGDVDFTTRVTTERQLRTGSAPNPWEAAWVLWHHTDNTHFYYVALKPNGFELGKEDPAYPGAQRFLVTLPEPAFAIGSTHTVRVKQVGNVMTVWVDGVLVTTFADLERPYTGGHIGLYNEDSTTRFTPPTISALS